MSNWAIQWVVSGELAGWPKPMVFSSRKEASARKNKLAHQSGADVVVVPTDLPVNAQQKIRRKKAVKFTFSIPSMEYLSKVAKASSDRILAGQDGKDEAD